MKKKKEKVARKSIPVRQKLEIEKPLEDQTNYLKETELTGYTEEEKALVKLEKNTSVKNKNERVTSVVALQG